MMENEMRRNKDERKKSKKEKERKKGTKRKTIRREKRREKEKEGKGKGRFLGFRTVKSWSFDKRHEVGYFPTWFTFSLKAI